MQSVIDSTHISNQSDHNDTALWVSMSPTKQLISHPPQTQSRKIILPELEGKMAVGKYVWAHPLHKFIKISHIGKNTINYHNTIRAGEISY